MSVREFAAHLGVSDRMVSKWEAGGEAIRPRPLNQAALDTSLALSSADVKSRFTSIAVRDAGPIPRPRPDGGERGGVHHLVRHPVDGKLMTMVPAGAFGATRPVWLPAFYIDIHPTTNAEYARFTDATGHPPPPRWPGRTCPEALAEHPVVLVTCNDAAAYTAWAAKSLPTCDQWDRAAAGDEGMTLAGVGEWCSAPAGPVRRAPAGVGEHEIGFRCASAALELLALLAI